jgi:2-dehydro-3-deoxyphosphooctonate aldolase (KDO 8-P synthase)
MSTHATPGPVVQVGAARFGNHLPLTLIAGPCQLEGRNHALEIAAALKEMAADLGIGLVFKTSFDKANRTSGSAARGIGLEGALPVFAEIRESLSLPVLTDVHAAEHCAPAAEAVDVLQIPAFLCRQTDLLLAAAATGRAVNIKKGQFLAPWDMKQGASSGGQREFVAVLARAAVAVGVAGVFIETHPDPDRAPSDGPNMVALRDLPALLEELIAFDRLAKRRYA